MCGPSAGQQQLSDEQLQFYKMLSDQYSTIFGQNQQITGALTQAFTPILQAGPSQTGMSPSEENALKTQNTENVATDYAQAQRATAQILAARGGGNTFLPSSVNANILAQNANAAAAQRATGQNQIVQQNYALGRQNWGAAADVLGSTAGLLNPNAYSGQATGAGSAAGETQKNMAAEAFAPWGAVTSMAGSVLGGAVGMPRIPGFGAPTSSSAIRGMPPGGLAGMSALF